MKVASYRKGKQREYADMENIGKRNSFFIYNKLNNDEVATPPPARPADSKPKGNRRNTGNK